MTGARRVSAWTALVLAVATPASATADVLTLDEAVTLALQNNRNLGVAAMQVKRSEQKVGAAKARRLPSLELQAVAGKTLTPIRISFPAGSFGTYPSTGPIPSADTVVEAPRAVTGNVNATVAQPITQLHKIGLNAKLSELSRDIDQEKLREERASTAADVRRLYYALLQTQSALEAKEEQVEAYRELDRVVDQQVAIEAALPSDGLSVKARRASEEYALAALQGDLATSKDQMNQMLGRDLGHDFSLAQVPETSLEEVDLQSATTRALDRRPDLAQARLAIAQADTDRRAKKAESIPELSLAFSYSSYINIDLLPRNFAQVGVQLKWEPFDWGRKGKEHAEKALQVEQARSNARQAEDGARIEVAQRFRKLKEARMLVEAQRLNREAAQEKLRVVTVQHRQEAALLKDVLEAQAAMSAAHAQYDQAVLTFWTAKADFQQALGEEQ